LDVDRRLRGLPCPLRSLHDASSPHPPYGQPRPRGRSRLPAPRATARPSRALEPLLPPPLPVEGEPPWSWFASSHVPGAGGGRAEPARRDPGALGVRLAAVSFSYPGSATPAIVGIDLEVPPAAFVAVTGPVGSGKSALARLAA